MEVNKIYNEDCLQGLKSLPDNSVDCCVTSPPYYALRDYGVDGQIGLEETPEEYIRKLTEVFMEVYRVLKPEGTLWLNIGDSYFAHNGSRGNKSSNGGDTLRGQDNVYQPATKYRSESNCKSKDLIGIPWMLAFSLRNAGWYLRQDIIWHKPNPMPESVTDRCTKSHEYIFLLSKSQKYYYDYEAIQESAVTQESGKNLGTRGARGYSNASGNQRDCNGGFPMRTKNCQYDGQQPNTMHLRREQGLPDKEYFVRNKRDVWSVNVKPDSVAHFATYPEELIMPCILAGCPSGGVVLDPFMGSGTTARVARKLNRHFVGFELNPEYCKIIEKKIQVEGDLFY